MDERIAKARESLPELERKVNFWNELRSVAQDNINARKEREAAQKRAEETAKTQPMSLREAIAVVLREALKGGMQLNLGDILKNAGTDEDSLKRLGWLASRGVKAALGDKGISVDDFVHNILAGDPVAGSFVTDEQDAINEVYDIIKTMHRRELGTLIARNREEEKKGGYGKEDPVAVLTNGKFKTGDSVSFPVNDDGEIESAYGIIVGVDGLSGRVLVDPGDGFSPISVPLRGLKAVEDLPMSVAADPRIQRVANAYEKAQTAWAETEKQLKEAKTPTERASIMREREKILREYMDEIKTDDTVVSSYAQIAGVLRSLGYPESTVEVVETEIAKALRDGDRPRAFYVGNRLFFLIEGILGIDDGRKAYVHERQHGITGREGYVQRVLGINGVTREALLDWIFGLSETHIYDGKPMNVLAEEAISMAMEVAYSSTPEDLEKNLRERGVNNQEFINFVKSIDNEQRNDPDASLARIRGGSTVYFSSVGEEGNRRQDAGNPVQESGVLGEELGEEQYGAVRPGSRGTEGGEGTSLGRLNAAKEQGEGGILFSIQGLPGYTEQDVANLVRDYINEQLDVEDGEFSIADIRVIGSRVQRKASEDSDLDVLVQYDGSMREDDAFNALHNEPLEIEGIEVDINPINTGKSGTADEWIRRHQTVDMQGNAINADGSLIADTVNSIDELTDEEFTSPSRSVVLPKIPARVDAAIGAGGKPVVI